MNVALIRKEFVAGRGGAERYAVNLGQGLASLGHKVHVFTGVAENKPYPNIFIHRVPFIKSPSPLKNLSFQYNSRKLVAQTSFDIVNGLSQVYPQDVYRVGEPLHIHWMRVQTPRPGRRLLKYINPRHQVILAIERNIFRKENYRRIIVNSRLCLHQVVRYYNAPEEKIRVVYNGADLELFNPGVREQTRSIMRQQLSIRENDIVLLFAGNDFKRKGLQFALQCALNLKSRGHRIKLLVAGRGNPAVYAKHADRAGFSEDLLFLGSVAALSELYGAADLLIHPTIYDPFSNVCLEAMACGLPVITTKCNGAADIIEDCVSGILVDMPWDIETMTAKVEPLLHTRDETLTEMSIRAAKAARHYSVGKNVEQTVAVYEEILREKGIAR